MNKALIIAAHPDDEILGCGATISKYSKSGVEFKVVFVGEGSSCRFKGPDDPLSALAVQDRRDCALNALELLGIKNFEFNNLPCGRFDQIPIIEINKIIERAIREFKPDTIYTHSHTDANNDHQIVFRSTIMASRPCPETYVERILSYEVLSSTEWSYTAAFKPNLFEEIQESDLILKCEALACYDSEIRPFPFPRSHQGIRTLAMYRGMQAGLVYGEAFNLIREYRK